MTENEAIELLRSMQNPKQDYAEVVCRSSFCTGYRYVYPEPEDYAIEEAISALKEIQQYREIGTVEECREAVEKQKPMKPDEVDYDFNYYKCPVCGGYIWSTDNVNKHRYCLECGQKIEWEEREEE